MMPSLPVCGVMLAASFVAALGVDIVWTNPSMEQISVLRTHKYRPEKGASATNAKMAKR
jgi:hypothetical protein